MKYVLVAHPTDETSIRDQVSRWISEYEEGEFLGEIPLATLQQLMWRRFHIYAVVYTEFDACRLGLMKNAFPIWDGMVSERRPCT